MLAIASQTTRPNIYIYINNIYMLAIANQTNRPNIYNIYI